MAGSLAALPITPAPVGALSCGCMAKTPSDRPPQPKPENFERALEELEALVRRMEAGDVPLDESLRLYERGTFLIRHCQDRLDSAERQIEQLTRGRDGRLETTGSASDAQG